VKEALDGDPIKTYWLGPRRILIQQNTFTTIPFRRDRGGVANKPGRYPLTQPSQSD